MNVMREPCGMEWPLLNRTGTEAEARARRNRPRRNDKTIQPANLILCGGAIVCNR